MEHRHAVNCRFFFTIFFYPQKEKGLFQHTVENEVSASSMLTFYKNQLLIGQEGSSLECLKSDTRTTPTLASTHTRASISSLQLGGSWINGVLDGHLFQVLFPILFTLHTVF